MWSSTVGFVNGRHRYLTAETFGFKINSNGQQLKRRQQWTIEPFPENLGPDGSISSAASVSSQPSQYQAISPQQVDPGDTCILTFNSAPIGYGKSSSSNGSSSSDQDICGEEHENVAIKSHLNKYLAVDSFGNVTCDSDEKTITARFTITICSMSQGRSKDEHIFWAFKNVERGYYLGTTDDGMICCNAKMPKSRAELWHLHLLPARGASFFAIKSLGRKRFARMISDENLSPAMARQQGESIQIQLDATLSWGSETLFQFKYYDGGQYSLLTSDNRHLTNEGKCLDWKPKDETSTPPAECLFTLEYHSGFLAFRDAFGHYLAAAGRSSILRSRSPGVSRDELFVFEASPIQVSLKATFNNRWVSIKQGVDLSANQTDTTSKFETFQMTFHKQTQNWSIMTQDCQFWTVSQNTSTISVCRPGDYEGLTRGQFKIIWSDSDATLCLKYVDINRQERWIAARKSGQLFLGSATQDPVKFIMRFQNRRLLNLRPVDGNGFVGLKSTNSKHLEANKTMPDSIGIEYSELPNNIMSSITNGQLTSNMMDQSSRRPPEVPAKPVMIENESCEHRTINVFNVRLNSTKMGQSVHDRFSTNKEKEEGRTLEVSKVDQMVTSENEKEIDCGIDSNNNYIESPPCKEENGGNNGSVELAAAPSVASIISSFSNAKLSNQSGQQCTATSSEQLSKQTRMGSSVSKLVSTFKSNGQSVMSAQSQCDNSDAASAITSCSSASGSSSSTSVENSTQFTVLPNINSSASLAHQVAQSECCYMKVLTANRYLIAGDASDPSIQCDATNKACAQAWILELRSHNSIAIRASDNQAYMQLGTNGTIYLARCDPKDASLWEF